MTTVVVDAALVDPQLVVFRGRGDGTFSAPSVTALSSVFLTLAVADFNGDGRRDLALGGDGTLAVLLNEGHGAFSNPQMVTLPQQGPTAMLSGDFNGDGQPDLAVGFESGELQVLFSSCGP